MHGGEVRHYVTLCLGACQRGMLLCYVTISRCNKEIDQKLVSNRPNTSHLGWYVATICYESIALVPRGGAHIVDFTLSTNVTELKKATNA